MPATQQRLNELSKSDKPLEVIAQRLEQITEDIASIKQQLGIGAQPPGPIGPPAQAPVLPSIEPPAGIEYHNGISRPDGRSVVRLQRFDQDTALKSVAQAYRERFGQDVLGPEFAVSPDEVRNAWPDVPINPALELNVNTAGTQIDGYRRNYDINGETQLSVTRYRADENDAVRAEDFAKTREAMERHLAENGDQRFTPHSP